MSFMYYFIFFTCSVTLFLVTTQAETLRHHLFDDWNPTCDVQYFQCTDGQCVDRNYLCSSSHVCRDRSCHSHCHSSSSQCPPHRPLSCKFQGNSRCVPDEWLCDGYKDCTAGEDEINCNDRKIVVSNISIRIAKYRAQAHLHTLRKAERQFRKWGTEVTKVSTAFFLSNDSLFFGNQSVRDEMAYEIAIEILSRVAVKKVNEVNSGELASYINALLVTCVDPRRFFTLDLVADLRKRVNEQNTTNPFLMLALCNAGEKMTGNDIERLKAVFWKANKKQWTDTQALSVLALSCASSQQPPLVEIQELQQLTLELKKRQYRNGTVENLKTTALVMQAVLSTDSEPDQDNFDEKKALGVILNSQHPDGSFGNTVNTYYVTPVLSGRSLVNVTSGNCTPFANDEEESFRDLENQLGLKWKIKFSLWRGDKRTLERTLALQVPANSSFYRIMEYAAGMDKKYRFEYSMRNGKPYPYSIAGIQDDPENELFWYPYVSANASSQTLSLILTSPADVYPKHQQHVVYWYKHRTWQDEATSP